MNKSSTGARRLTVQELDSIFEYIVHKCTAADFSHSAGVTDTKTGRDKVRTLAGEIDMAIPAIADREILRRRVCYRLFGGDPHTPHPSDANASWQEDLNAAPVNELWGTSIPSLMRGSTGPSYDDIKRAILRGESLESMGLHAQVDGDTVYVSHLPTTPVTLPTLSTTKAQAMTKTITVEQRTFINGTDARSFTDAQLYDLIAQQEAAIADLDKIQNKPARLVDEIAKRKAGIDALVSFLNAKDGAA